MQSRDARRIQRQGKIGLTPDTKRRAIDGNSPQRPAITNVAFYEISVDPCHKKAIETWWCVATAPLLEWRYSTTDMKGRGTGVLETLPGAAEAIRVDAQLLRARIQQQRSIVEQG